MKFLNHFKEKYSAQIPLFTGIFIAIAVLSISIFFAGYEIGRAYPKVVKVENVTNTASDKEADVNFGTFWEAWDMLRNEHLKGADPKNQDLVYGAIKGLTGSFGDPHTVFFPPEDSKKFEEDVVGNFGGIGAEIGIKDKQLVVIAPLKGNPAEAVGLEAGDKIFGIDGKPTDSLDVNEAVKKIRGEIGTAVILTVFRDGWDKTEDFKIVRANIIIPTLETKLIDYEGKKLAHVSLFAFNQNAPAGFYKEVIFASINGAEGIILDLRNNPGGFLEVAINLAGWFVNKGEVVVSEKFRNGTGDVFRADGNQALKDAPIVILVNKGSASASEILAGALRAIRGTKLIGTNTFGKGTVQELRSLSDNSKIKLTIANWVLPDGTIIGEEGIEPDFKVEISDEDAKNKFDSQLEKAKEVLLQEINAKSL